MPYIKEKERNRLDNPIRGILFALQDTKPEEIDGKMNYIITRLIHNLYGINYFHLNKAIGMLECAKLELYRRIVAPYEDEKIKENGDV